MEKEKKIIYREASHYNSWYMGPEERLKAELEKYISEAKLYPGSDAKNIRGMICPHAGIMWSGRTAAWGFINLSKMRFKRVFILGPSHFAKFKGCGLSIADYWRTPFGDLTVDKSIIKDLKTKELFYDLPLDIDIYEHSLEMQIPYIKYFTKDMPDVTIVPIMTGKLNLQQEKHIAKVLLDYYKDDENIFVISEDFCHWGPRHDFWYHEEKNGKIYQSIEYIDKLAFESIVKKDSDHFSEYLAKWKNNLCGGGSPVTIYVAIMELAEKDGFKNNIEFVRYDKSNPKISSEDEESVSYAVAINSKI